MENGAAACSGGRSRPKSRSGGMIIRVLVTQIEIPKQESTFLGQIKIQAAIKILRPSCFQWKFAAT
jgi:hypothetical protein